MEQYPEQLNGIFQALADPTRRADRSIFSGSAARAVSSVDQKDRQPTKSKRPPHPVAT
jgi:hypothetical protein